MSTLHISQHKSSAGTNHAQRETLRTLGLRGIGSAVERTDGPAVRGLVRVVAHLVTVGEAAEQNASGSKRARSGAAKAKAAPAKEKGDGGNA